LAVQPGSLPARIRRPVRSPIENVIPPRQGPPLHIHGREDEMYLILDGHLRFKAGGQLFDAPAGSFVFIPRVTPHGFQTSVRSTLACW
jgi:mannose-6-phosphate isomerase-like protein (cupin superfamily)